MKMKKVIFAALVSTVCLISGCMRVEARYDMKKGSDMSYTAPESSDAYSAPTSENSTDSSVLPTDEPEKTDRIVWVGDSRIIQLGNKVYGIELVDNDLANEETSDGDCILGAVGEGYDWLAEHTAEIEDKLTDGCALVVNMGVNGIPDYHSEIAEWCNEIAEKYKDRGVKVYFMSINPVNDKLMKYNNYIIRDVDVVCFNSVIRTELKGVTYLDTYSEVRDDIIGEGSGTYDGLHYNESVYRKIKDYTCKIVKKE